MPLYTLRRWRLRQALTQARIAARYGYTQKDWQRWEKHYSKPGARKPSATLIALFERDSNGQVNLNSWSPQVMDACNAARVLDLRYDAGRMPAPPTRR